MFGFKRKKKKKPEVGCFKELPEVRNLLKDLLGNAMNAYIGTVAGYLTGLDKTADDVKESRTKMLTVLQKYVQAEILLNRQNHGHGPDPTELAGLRFN